MKCPVTGDEVDEFFNDPIGVHRQCEDIKHGCRFKCCWDCCPGCRQECKEPPLPIHVDDPLV